MDILRTPDNRFDRLPHYPFAPNYRMVGDNLRMHFVDEGPRDGKVVLMLHGEPSWSFLYRHMIPVCVAAGHRVIAPDLIGFGKSDKPAAIEDYTYARHMNWMQKLIDDLRLEGITLVCQDWGSLIGLRLAAENPSRFDSIVVGNGMLPTGDEGILPMAFKAWKTFAQYSPLFPISRIVDVGTGRALSPEERRAYDAPFPTAKYKAGARAFPMLVPTTPHDPASPANRDAWKVLGQWNKPFLTTFSRGDPITRGLDKRLQDHIPGAQGQPHCSLRGGHFLQEDSGAEFAQAVNDLIAREFGPTSRIS